MSELKQITGSVIKEFSEKREGLWQHDTIEDFVYKSIMYAVGTRCGFELSGEEQDFHQIEDITDEEVKQSEAKILFCSIAKRLRFLLQVLFLFVLYLLHLLLSVFRLALSL